MESEMNSQIFELSNGETYFVRFESTSPSNPALVFLHGLWQDSMTMTNLVPYLKEKYFIIIPDLRGNGKSSYKNPLKSIDDLVEDIEYLLQKLNINKIGFVGVSAGSIIAIRYALLYPEKVTGLVLACPPGPAGLPIFKENVLPRQLATKIEELKELKHISDIARTIETKNYGERANSFNEVAFSPGKLPDAKLMKILTETVCDMNAFWDYRWILHTYNYTDNHKFYAVGDDSLKNLRCPIVINTGEKDKMSPKIIAQEWIEALGDKLIMREIKNAGHLSCWYGFEEKITEDINRICK
jgi:pimeloyl-ACP methyl ester carboxylesterase